MKDNKIFKKNPQMISREISGQIVLVPLGKLSDQASHIYTLNETAAQIWGLIDGKRSLAKIRGLLLSKYKISEAMLKKEIEELCADLKSIGALLG
jgi:hypothetical protein